ncbi:cadherin-like and PC-esterase domain-containing protein 1 [Pseudoliparis swirei]|uniref:cadherin-like and PC-esterase domain-containing protein 1 n=1 Tax=Pseudoliparis swirei TaxID=2059687 RepID=UPI0024BDC0C8|nr:cadherin-like and PC-esterase domain-containing protein 1 [Pseudoliparis swirei]
MVNIYVLVTSLKPLTSFLHDIIVVTTNQEPHGRPTQLRDFLLAASHDALGQIKRVTGDVLLAALSTNEKQETLNWCVLCYQLLTFTLLFGGSVSPVVIQVETGLTFSSVSREALEDQTTRDRILEDSLRFLHLDSETPTQFQRQMKTASSFQLLYPSSSSSSSSSSSGPLSVSDLLISISRFYEIQRNQNYRTNASEERTNQEPSLSRDMFEGRGPCVDPHLRQIYSDPPLTLTPPFSPWVKAYRAQVTFDTVTVRIRPRPVSSACRVHLDEQRGPGMANYPVGLGNSRISILVTGGGVVMAIYTVHVFRESRPSLPMFGDHVTCGFVQDCGLLVQPWRSCGLQPLIRTPFPLQTCSSGHQPGRWVVPCLSCSDNRTCDWREVAWQPDGCYHPLVDRPRLQDCLTDRKVLFLGDSTNRGMMFFLVERLNSSLGVWVRAHDTLVYRDLNRGRTLVSYSYYPQFWLDQDQRPTFKQALLQLIDRSRPLVNSNRTVLVVGGVQWLSTNHLRTLTQVLSREALSEVLVLVKSLGIGFHLPVDGIRSLSLEEVQDLHRENQNIIATAKHSGYEVIDTFSITMGRHKEFLQGRCGCHFHEVEFWSSRAGPEPSSQSDGPHPDKEVRPKATSYHVRGPVNQVYSEILLSRLCPRD